MQPFDRLTALSKLRPVAAARRSGKTSPWLFFVPLCLRGELCGYCRKELDRMRVLAEKHEI